MTTQDPQTDDAQIDDITTLRRGDLVQVNGELYRVHSASHDGNESRVTMHDDLVAGRGRGDASIIRGDEYYRKRTPPIPPAPTYLDHGYGKTEGINDLTVVACAGYVTANPDHVGHGVRTDSLRGGDGRYNINPRELTDSVFEAALQVGASAEGSPYVNWETDGTVTSTYLTVFADDVTAVTEAVNQKFTHVSGDVSVQILAEDEMVGVDPRDYYSDANSSDLHDDRVGWRWPAGVAQKVKVEVGLTAGASTPYLG